MSADNNFPSSFELQEDVSDDNSKVLIRQALEALVNGLEKPGEPDDKEYKINVRLTFTPSPMKKIQAAKRSQTLDSSTTRNEPLTNQRKQTSKGNLSWSSNGEEKGHDESAEYESDCKDMVSVGTPSDSKENKPNSNDSISKKSGKQKNKQPKNASPEAGDCQTSSAAVEITPSTKKAEPEYQDKSRDKEPVVVHDTFDTPTEETSEIYEDLAAFSSELWDSKKWDSFCTTVDDLKKIHKKHQNNGARTSSNSSQKNNGALSNKALVKKTNRNSQKATQERWNEGNFDQSVQEIFKMGMGGNAVAPENLPLLCSRLEPSDLDDYFDTTPKSKKDKPKEESADAQLHVDSDRTTSDLGNGELDSPVIQRFKKKKNKHKKGSNEDLHTNESDMDVHHEEIDWDLNSFLAKEKKIKKKKRKNNEENNDDLETSTQSDRPNKTKKNGNIAESPRRVIDHEATTDEDEFDPSQIFRTMKLAKVEKSKDLSTQEEFAKDLFDISNDLARGTEDESNCDTISDSFASKKSKKIKKRNEEFTTREIHETQVTELEDLVEDQSNCSSPKKSKKRKKRDKEALTSDETPPDDDSERKKKHKKYRNSQEDSAENSARKEETDVERDVPNGAFARKEEDIVQESALSGKKVNRRRSHNSQDEIASINSAVGSSSDADIANGASGESKVPQKSTLEEILDVLNGVFADEDRSPKKSEDERREEEAVTYDATAPPIERINSAQEDQTDFEMDILNDILQESGSLRDIPREESEILHESKSPTKKKRKWPSEVPETTNSSLKTEEVCDTEMLDDYFAPAEHEILQGSQLSTKRRGKNKRRLADDVQSAKNTQEDASSEVSLVAEDAVQQEHELAPKRKKKKKFRDHQEELPVDCAQDEEQSFNRDIVNEISEHDAQLPTKKKKKRRKPHEDQEELLAVECAQEEQPSFNNGMSEHDAELPTKKKKNKWKSHEDQEELLEVDCAQEEQPSFNNGMSEHDAELPTKKKKNKWKSHEYQEELLKVDCAQEEQPSFNHGMSEHDAELPTKKKKKKEKLHAYPEELLAVDYALQEKTGEAPAEADTESEMSTKKKKKKRRKSHCGDDCPRVEESFDMDHTLNRICSQIAETILQQPASPTRRKKQHHKFQSAQDEEELISSTRRDEIDQTPFDTDISSVEMGHPSDGGSSFLAYPTRKSKKKHKHHDNTTESEETTVTEISTYHDYRENDSHKKRRESKEYHILTNVQEPISELDQRNDGAHDEQNASENDAPGSDTILYIREESLEKDSTKSNISTDSPHGPKIKAAIKRRRTSSICEDYKPAVRKRRPAESQSILADLMYTENPKVHDNNDQIKPDPERVILNDDSDVEDAVDRAKEAQKLSAERSDKIKSLNVMMDWKPNPLHLIETRICGAPNKDQWALIKLLDVNVKSSVFTKEEDAQIMENWRRFCEVHDWGDDPEPFLNKKILRNIPLRQRIEFARFIARGLDNRLLRSVFGRFQRLVDMKRVRGRFTPEEDRIIVEYINKTDSNVPFADLAKLLSRNNTAVIKRCRVLSAREDQIKWTEDNIKTFVRHMLKVTKKTDVEELRDFILTDRHWSKMSKRMDVPVAKLRRAWTCTIQPRIFAFEDIGTDEVKTKLIDLLYKNHEYDWRNINWDEYAKEFETENLNGARLSKFLKRMVSYYCPTNIHDDLRACLKCLKKVVVKNVVFYHKKIRKVDLDLSN